VLDLGPFDFARATLAIQQEAADKAIMVMQVGSGICGRHVGLFACGGAINIGNCSDMNRN
jgi:hypothetical protein